MSSPSLSPPASAADAQLRRRILSGYLLLLLAVLLWSGNSIVGRASADENIPPMGLNFWRWTTAFLLFVTIFGRATWRQRHEILAHWKFIVPFALVSIVGFNVTFYMALQRTTALQASLIQSILPVLVLLYGLVLLRERITGRQWWGVLFSIAGAGLIVVRGEMAVLRTLTLNDGDVWALGAVFLWGWQAFLMRWKPKSIGIMPFMTTISFVGVLAMAPLYAWETATVRAMPLNETSVLFVLYVGVMAGFFGTSFWNEGTYRAGSAQAGYFGNMYPIFAGILAILILGEEPRWYHFAGAASVIVGIWLATAQHARRAGQA
ncbi:MAG: DMT family transporter [Rhodospirillaceae bacterium]